MTTPNNTDHVKKITQALDMTTNDDQLNEQLADMRNTALRHIPEASERSIARQWFVWPSLGAVAAALVLFVSISGTQEDESTALVDNLALLTESEELEMFETHDIEFYVWLEEELAQDKS